MFMPNQVTIRTGVSRVIISSLRQEGLIIIARFILPGLTRMTRLLPLTLRITVRACSSSLIARCYRLLESLPFPQILILFKLICSLYGNFLQQLICRDLFRPVDSHMYIRVKASKKFRPLYRISIWAQIFV